MHRGTQASHVDTLHSSARGQVAIGRETLVHWCIGAFKLVHWCMDAMLQRCVGEHQLTGMAPSMGHCRRCATTCVVAVWLLSQRGAAKFLNS